MASIREVAKIAGVSPATVSRVMNGSAGVSPEKQNRVLEAIEKTGFVPNEVARSLFKRSARTIGLIIPSIRNPYFTQLASQVDACAGREGYRIFLCSVQQLGRQSIQQTAARRVITQGQAVPVQRQRKKLLFAMLKQAF